MLDLRAKTAEKRVSVLIMCIFLLEVVIEIGKDLDLKLLGIGEVSPLLWLFANHASDFAPAWRGKE